jgi:hypothetical protein
VDTIARGAILKTTNNKNNGRNLAFGDFILISMSCRIILGFKIKT